MVTITLPSELEKAISEEAAQKGTTVEVLTLDVLQERFLRPSSEKQLPISEKQLPIGATLADWLADCIGSVNTRDKYPEGSTLSENTGAKFAQLMAEKRKQSKY